MLFACKKQAGPIERKVEKLLAKMSLQEKVGQMNQLNGHKAGENLYEKIRRGGVGSILNAEDPVQLNKIQKIAVEETRLGIPLIFARDVIHGYKTIFPIPLGQAASFNPDIVEKGARVAAIEASEAGIRWTFAPMMDISRDARWGRIAESFGEDSYLTERLAVAMVNGFQGEKLSDPTSIAACAKHFIGYGAAEGGRDYNSTHIADRQLRNVYMLPFEAAVKSGCASIMTSFSDNDGIPASGNEYLLRQVLRNEWKFDGITVSDWESVKEMINHGFCQDAKEAAFKAVKAGLDMEMVSSCYNEHLVELIETGKISEELINEPVRNILRLKFRLGLFERPYLDTASVKKTYSKAHLQLAQRTAEESFVLLKNENNILPLSISKIRKLAVIGPMADAPHDQLGTWSFDGDKQYTQTPLSALKGMYDDAGFQILYAPGVAYSRDKSKSLFAQALAVAKQADAIVVFVGEEAILSGEAHSLADLNLQGAQSDLINELEKANKPLISVVMAGRPLTIYNEIQLSDAVLYAWHPGTMGGPAIANMLFGKTVPSGKLPVTFPKITGQIPIYYNHNHTGRPPTRNETLIDDIPLEAKQSSLGCSSYYLDAAFDPLFPFGYGLSYTSFKYSDLSLSSDVLGRSDTLEVNFSLTNTGNYDAKETAQLYTSDLFASIARPVKELQVFEKIFLKTGETRKIRLRLPIQQLAFWDINMNKSVEPGKFRLSVGGSSEDGLIAFFNVK